MLNILKNKENKTGANGGEESVARIGGKAF